MVPLVIQVFFELISIKSGESIEFVENYIWRLVALKMKITKNNLLLILQIL